MLPLPATGGKGKEVPLATGSRARDRPWGVLKHEGDGDHVVLVTFDCPFEFAALRGTINLTPGLQRYLQINLINIISPYHQSIRLLGYYPACFYFP